MHGSVGEGTSDTFVIQNAQANGFVSFVLRGADDYQVEILNDSDSVLDTVNRGGLGVEEAGQTDWTTSPTTVKVKITGLACASPYNIAGDCGVGVVDFLEMLAAWGPNPGHPADFDDDDEVGVTDFLELLANWGESNYLLEVMSRSN